MKRSAPFVVSKTGRRDTNQDRACAVATSLWGKPALVMAVADGMGGLHEGEAAAELAIHEVRTWAADALPLLEPGPQALTGSLVDMYQRANRAVWDYGGAQGFPGQVGTTLVCCVVVGMQYVVANVGDSRCYYLNDHGARRLTVDHSRVQEMVQRGLMTEEAARRSPFRNELTNSLGEPTDVPVDISPDREHLAVIDEPCVLLLCSDGVHGKVLDEQILEVLRSTASVREGGFRLLDVALENGSSDNLSVAAVECGRLRSRRVATGEHAGAPPLGPVTVKISRRWRERRRPIAGAAAGVVLVAVLGGLVWWLGVGRVRAMGLGLLRGVAPPSAWLPGRGDPERSGGLGPMGQQTGPIPEHAGRSPGQGAGASPPASPVAGLEEGIDRDTPNLPAGATAPTQDAGTSLSAASGSGPPTMAWRAKLWPQLRGNRLEITCRAISSTWVYVLHYSGDPQFQSAGRVEGGDRCRFEFELPDSWNAPPFPKVLFVRVEARPRSGSPRVSETREVQLPGGEPRR